MEKCTMNGLAHIKRNDVFFMTVSRLLVELAKAQRTAMYSGHRANGPSPPPKLDFSSDVEKDGPGKKAAPTCTLRTLDGDLYFFDNGNMAKNGTFKYFHITPNNMSVALKIGIGQGPSLVPPFEPGTKLREQYKKSTPTSEVGIIMGAKSGYTLALEYDDSAQPPVANLVTISDEHLQMILAMESAAKPEKSVQPIITRRTLADGEDTDANNIALYFVTSRFYYFMHVDSEVNPPQLKLERINKEDPFDPHKDFMQHLQFMYKVLSCECPDCTKSPKLDQPDGACQKNKVESTTPSSGTPQGDAPTEEFLRSDSEGSEKPSSLPLYALDARQNSVEKDGISKKQMIANTPPEKETEERGDSKDVDTAA